MRAFRQFHLFPLITLLLSSTMVFTLPTAAQTIHALLIGSDTNIPEYAKNMDRVVKLLRTVATQDICTLEEVRVGSVMDNSTPASEQTKDWLENVRPGGNDVVFVYYSAVDDFLNQEEVVSKLDKMTGRLKIFITDTDFHIIEITENGSGFINTDPSESVLESLFVEHKGFLNLTSKSESEFAFGDANGGWFTQALIHAIYAAPTNGDNPVTWKDILKTTQAVTQESYSKNSDVFSDELRASMNIANIKKSQTPTVLGDFPTLTLTVHALLVINDIADAGNRSIATINHTRIRGLFREAETLGICNLHIQTLRSSENSLTRDNITAWAEALQPDNNDTICIYYSANETEPNAEDQGDLIKQLEKVIEGENAKKSRLRMLIIDTYRLGPVVQIPRFGLPYPQTSFYNLFLEHEGFLYLVSKSENELSFGDGSDGGWFTRALIESIYEIRRREDFPSQVPDNGERRTFLEWDELVEKTGNKLKEELFKHAGFKDVENYPVAFSDEEREKLLEDLETAQKSQTPQARELPQKTQ